MRIGAISDMHGNLPPVPVGLDVLLVAGDVGPATRLYHRDMEYADAWLNGTFANWLRSSGCPVVGIAGNHDFVAQRRPHVLHGLPWAYLCDSGTTHGGFKFWGSPWTPTFMDWAFMGADASLKSRWDAIPVDTDVLITHGPPRGHGDQAVPIFGDALGSESLGVRVAQLGIKLHVFGHIHGSSGYRKGREANVAHVNEAYIPEHPVREFEI